eukprot:TRINITY_DN4719_c0_g1_i1.p1 TRINITY_DN4719_c0_g1~~TRINITY_DN4719_c0_g1_i1.p1  ORF type:complete len:363 (+),score=47.07 TRINITY_DN4719_c0_g1_i1:176-1264(+)
MKGAIGLYNISTLSPFLSSSLLLLQRRGIALSKNSRFEILPPVINKTFTEADEKRLLHIHQQRVMRLYGGKQADYLRRFKPTTPSLRHTVLVRRPYLWKGRPIKELSFGKRSTGGRNNTGRITIWQRGGGHKRLIRLVDFKREVLDLPGKIQRFEYDPNRSANIALVTYPNGKMCYVLAPKEVVLGDEVLSTRSKEIPLKAGNCMPLKMIPDGTVIHNIELSPGKGGQLARSAGTYGEVLEKTTRPGYVAIRLASKESRYVLDRCVATIGTVSNPMHHLRVLGKAGRSRWLGRRPNVRGVAMNPVDHPHGGSVVGGPTSRTPWGKPTKGYVTRRPHVRNSKYVIQRPREARKQAANAKKDQS